MIICKYNKQYFFESISKRFEKISYFNKGDEGNEKE